MSLNNRNFTILFNSKEFCCYNSSTPSLAARNFFSNIKNKINNTKKIEFFVKETTKGSKQKIYGPYIGNKDKVYLKNNRLIGGFSQKDLFLNKQQPNNLLFAKKGDNCVFFKPILIGDKYYYQYIVCKTFFKNYEFKSIIGNKTKNIEIMSIDKETLKQLKIFIELKNMFHSLQTIIDSIIPIKNKGIKQFENKELGIKLDELLIKKAFIQDLNENYYNEVITLSDIKIKKLSINDITYVFFNPVPLVRERNKIRPEYFNNKYYYRYIIYVKDDQLMFKEIFKNKETSELSIRQIDIQQINKENLAKMNEQSKKLINESNTNSYIKNIYNRLEKQIL
jgi:hypothetical protein